MMRPDANQGLADRLFLVKYEIDEENCHLVITDQQVCRDCEERPCIPRCPAEVYRWEESEEALEVAYENCLECGACRIVCPYENIDWSYPRGGFGVAYKYG